MAYVLSSTILDSVLKRFIDTSDSRVSTWLSRADAEIENVAQILGVNTDDFITPLHPKILEYGRAVFGMLVCLDNIGINNIDSPEEEKYRVKYTIYKDLSNELKSQITYEMFTQESEDIEPSERVAGGIIWRG
jgi:hypothetical protein